MEVPLTSDISVCWLLVVCIFLFCITYAGLGLGVPLVPGTGEVVVQDRIIRFEHPACVWVWCTHCVCGVCTAYVVCALRVWCVHCVCGVRTACVVYALRVRCTHCVCGVCTACVVYTRVGPTVHTTCVVYTNTMYVRTYNVSI